MDSIPEIKIDTARGGSKAASKTKAATATATLKAAGSLVAKKGERTKLVTVTLPRAYAELGKNIYNHASRREEFADLFQSVDKLISERKRIADESKARPAGTTVTDKVKKAAADATDIAKTKAMDLQAFQAFAKLGEAVFQQHGSSAEFANLVEPITKAIARREQLDREMVAINASAKGRWITPKRIVWGVGTLAVLAVLGNLTKEEPLASKASKPRGTSQVENTRSISTARGTRTSDAEDRRGWEGYAESLRNDVKRSERELKEYAEKAKTAKAELAAGQKPNEDEGMWELRRESRELLIAGYAKAKQSHDELLQKYSEYTKEVEQENKEVADAAKQAEDSRRKEEHAQEETKKRIAKLMRSRRPPTMDSRQDKRGLAEYKEGWEEGIMLAYKWLDRAQQGAQGRTLEKYVAETPLAKAQAEEQLNALRQNVEFAVEQMTREVKNLRDRGITIDLDHPNAAAAHKKWRFATGKQDAYAAVVFPLIYPMTKSK